MQQDKELKEIPDAMSLLDEAIGSLRHDANVSLLSEIIKVFAANGVSLHDFLLAASNAIANRHGNDAAREINRHLELAAAAAATMQSRK